MHTDHSPDCATPAELLLETAKEQGLGAIAITDHNEISGALEAREIAERIGGIKVIVAEEVKTAHEGEVIGLFLDASGSSAACRWRRRSPRSAARAGSSTSPIPSTGCTRSPTTSTCSKIVDEIDILEVFNPRVAFSAFNEEAVRFARKYSIVPGAGSDSHVAQGLGSVKIRLRDFDGPRSSSSRCGRRTSSASTRTSSTSRRSSSCRPAAAGEGARSPSGTARKPRSRRRTASKS